MDLLPVLRTAHGGSRLRIARDHSTRIFTGEDALPPRVIDGRVEVRTDSDSVVLRLERDCSP